jgi:hypothetical protein
MELAMLRDELKSGNCDVYTGQDEEKEAEKIKEDKSSSHYPAVAGW